jgi:hypothetical protein
MPGQRNYCHYCRAVHEPVEETRAEIDELDDTIELLAWIGIASIAMAMLLWALLA